MGEIKQITFGINMPTGKTNDIEEEEEEENKGYTIQVPWAKAAASTP